MNDDLCSASSYWTVDIYKGFLRPHSTKAQQIRQARLSTLAIMLAGWGFVLLVHSINEIWGFVTMAIGGTAMWPSLFAWYWARYVQPFKSDLT
jgi:Na+/proline symporter